jgi:hypothetical protein
VGKTIVALALGMAIALGRPLWELWNVSRGPWLHLDYEQGRRHTKARIHRLARGFGVSDEELRELIEVGTVRIVVMPDLRLTTPNATDHFRRVFDGVRLVTCDSLRVMLGGIDENSSQVRALMSAISSASDATGAAVALIHHAGKTRTDGDRSRKEMARGSSAIVDELQSMFVMSKKRDERVTLVTHEKDRELGGETVADFGLRIDDVATDNGDPKGALRVAYVDRDEMSDKIDTGSASFAIIIAAALDRIRDNPGIAGAEAVAGRVGGRRTTVRAAVKQLVTDGTVVACSSPRGGVRLYVKEAVPMEDS